MICQKCGLQEATVHLESVVFRVTIQEHLCRICAGVRAPAEPEECAPWATRPGAIDRSAADYAAVLERLPRLSGAQETRIFKRIERAELGTRRALWKIPSIGDYLLELGAKLLAGKERFERVIDVIEAGSLNAYFKSLPKLVDATRRAREAAIATWQDCVMSRSRREKKRLLIRHRRREAALRALFPTFHFSLEVYQAYLMQQEPLLKEIANYVEALKRTKNSQVTVEPAADALQTQSRVPQIELDQRMPVSALAKAAGEAKRHLWAAGQTKARLMTANLHRVASIARKVSGTGLPSMAAMMDGNCGLMEAIETFDYRRGRAFGAFAARKIRRAIALRTFAKSVYGTLNLSPSFFPRFHT
jgi:RNA polymerase primary sigma factor